jgi:hypothetical protein
MYVISEAYLQFCNLLYSRVLSGSINISLYTTIVLSVDVKLGLRH